MGIVIGIDVGGSTTKTVGIDDKEIKNLMFVRVTDPVTSLFGAFGKYLYDNDIPLSVIEKVMLTGVGSAFLTKLPQCKEIFPRLEEMYGGRFHVPEYAEYRTAIGAALTYINRRKS